MNAANFVAITLGSDFAPRAETLPDLLAALPSTALYATPYAHGCPVMYPRPVVGVPDFGDLLAYRLSLAGDCSALLADVRNDTLRLRLFRGGISVDEYATEPFDSEAPPRGGDVDALLCAFGRDPADREFLAPLLRAERFDEDYGYGSATERLSDIAELLGVPALAIGGFDAVSQGLVPEDVSSADLLYVESPAATVEQYTLLRVPDGTSEAEIASYLLSEIVSLERGIEVDDWVSDFGTPNAVKSAVLAVFGGGNSARDNWLAIPWAGGATLHVDIGDGVLAETVETVRVFSVAPNGVGATDAVNRLAAATSSVAWDWKTRRVLLG